ncbi:hypothetical protein [Streptomyces sp. NPDC015125]|uniref:hypothetical protein n=1 Tax=Streptomyces sp. NPDC015125 TaxID=3364938 RepID=UPI0036F63A13
MHLNVTPDLIRELAAAPGQPANTAIVLNAHGWYVRSWADHSPTSGLVTLTQEGLGVWLDGTELDDENAAALCEPDDSAAATYQLPDENGDRSTPDNGVDWQVITSELEDVDEFTRTPDWTRARWFDADAAVKLVGEDSPDAFGRTSSLWRTRGGRYLLRLRSSNVAEMPLEWAELSPALAVEYTYRAAERITDAALPPLLEAARHAAGLVAALTVPQWQGDPGPDVHRARARRVLGSATETVHATKELSELLRHEVLSDLRTQRQDAARTVVAAFGGDRYDAAEHLRMSYPTLSHLL